MGAACNAMQAHIGFVVTPVMLLRWIEALDA